MNETIETLIKEYREHAEAHGRATLSGDYKAANRSHDKLVALVPKIRALGHSGEAALVVLTDDSSDTVVCWAATHSLRFSESRALAALEKLSKKTGPIAFSAKMVVQQWAKGELKV
ncbi:DUF2019 domain-containing protein [Termitidicoccus mucosus]|uniref:Uncharacterized protein n=1 Tax=Termitidicoccus mucosus TaxID=1184151 RepID=A0A178IQJ6_9BACT|nr:hypothetical protein AW736_01840 [Opitutaceae bacterium TSB47]